jgi:hypothetical protein
MRIPTPRASLVLAITVPQSLSGAPCGIFVFAVYWVLITIYNHVTRQTYTTQKQVYWRGLLDTQKQENRRKEDRTQEI